MAESRKATQTRAMEMPALVRRLFCVTIVHKAVRTPKGDGRKMGEIHPRGAAMDQRASTSKAVPAPAANLTPRGNAPRKTNIQANGGLPFGCAGMVWLLLT